MTRPVSQILFGQNVSANEPPVESWSVSRSLSSWGLPGQAKIPTGVGTGQGQVTVLEEVAGPWEVGSYIAPGQVVNVQVTPDARTPMTNILTGVVREVSADGSDPQVRTASIEDDIAALGRTPRVAEAFASGPTGAYIDAAYIIDQCARTAGYYSSQKLDTFVQLSVPLRGSIAPERGTQVNGYTGAAAWTTRTDQQVVPANLPETAYRLNADLEIGFGMRLRAKGRANSTAAIQVRVYNAARTAFTTISFRHTGSAWEWQRAGSGVWATASLMSALDCEWEITWDSDTQVSVRYRTVLGNPGVWQSAGSQTGTSFAGAYWREVVLSGEISDVQATRVSAQLPALAAPTAYIAASGIPLDAIIIPQGKSCWEVMQEVARACSAALWIDEDGCLWFMPLSRFVSRGSGGKILQVQSELATRPWAISRDDYADRLEVTYTPPSIATVTNYSLPVWESTDVVMVPANSTIVIQEPLSVAAASLGSFSTGDWKTIPSSGSYFCAARAAKNGTQQLTGVVVSGTLITPHLIRVSITNNNSFPVWMVDKEGNPVIIARANKTASSGEQGMVEFGVEDEESLVPAQIDLGTYVQTESMAQSLGQYLWERLQSPSLFIRGVEVWPSRDNRLGNIFDLVDAPGGLPATRVALTKIENSGSDGSWRQVVDIAFMDSF